jgi:hypothetical protein
MTGGSIRWTAPGPPSSAAPWRLAARETRQKPRGVHVAVPGTRSRPQRGALLAAHGVVRVVRVNESRIPGAQW